MPIVHAVVETPIRESFRARQVAGMFDLPDDAGGKSEFVAEIPSVLESWNIGVIVGPSGSGKTTIARQAFGDRVAGRCNWPVNQSMLEGFPRGMTIREITQLLGSVGFSSPPAWMRPFHLLSNGEQFRVSVARTLAELPDLAVVDEFTSVVDRTVAKIGSAAIGRWVRRSDRRFVAVTCHYDVVPWLEPDWVVDMADGSLSRGRLRRPKIRIRVVRSKASAWRFFGRHHYLTGGIHPSAKCFVGLVENRPAAFVAVLPFPHPVSPGWREHRCVCLPDFQGVGIGNALSEFAAGMFAATGKPYTSVTSHPGMIHHRVRSSKWRMTRRPSRANRFAGEEFRRLNGTSSRSRMTASFKFIGAANHEAALSFGVIHDDRRCAKNEGEKHA